MDSYFSVEDKVETFQVLSDAEIIAEVQIKEVVEDDAEEEEEDIVCPSLHQLCKPAKHCLGSSTSDKRHLLPHLTYN